MFGCVTDSNGVSQGDVFCNSEYIGRLFIFPTKDPILLNMGIQQEWFLLGTTGTVQSGHINTEEQWSLSETRSLRPSWDYASANEVLERVASLILGNSQEEDTAPAPTDSPVLDRPSLTDLDTAWTSFITSMQPLQDLIASEEQEKKAAETEELITEQEEWVDSPIEQSVLDSLIEEDESKLSTSEIEELIIEECSREYKLQQATEFLLPPFGEVTVHAEEEYFVLRSHDTGRTIMSATMAGEIINEISEADTDIFNQVLKQSEIEVNKLPESELSREDAQSNLLNPSPFNNTSTQKGFEYDG